VAEAPDRRIGPGVVVSLAHFPIAKLLLQVGISIFLIFYFKVRYELF
jgi:hypothetical protein